MRFLIADNPFNLGAHWMIEISSVLQSAHMVPRNQDKVVFYINKYINWNQFNQLYDLDQIEKKIQNADLVTHKLEPASIKATNHRLEDVKKEKQTREEIVERRKAETLAAKCRRAGGEISSSSAKERNYESDIEDDMDPDQVDNKYPLQL